MILDNILANLNEPQKQAVQTIDGRVRVIAGAGSGKTRVLANRYAFLAEVIGIDPANIVCITFTNKAAQEMRTRIGKMVHCGNVNDFVCTIHSFCVKILRREIHRISFPQNFIILDDEDAKSFVKQAVGELKLGKEKSTDQRLYQIAVMKSDPKVNYIEDTLLPNSPCKIKEKDPFFHRFLELQLKNFALDYNDLINLALYILNKYQDAKDYWQNKVNFLQVDEVQDCSTKDWELIEILCGLHQNLFIVGDPDQAIYEWRGSRPELFVNFKYDHNIILDENYRSTQTILDVANSIIKNNKERVDKRLHTHKVGDILTIYHHGNCEEEEGAWISGQIKTQIEAGVSPSDFAILYRAGSQSRFIEQALMNDHIDYVIWGGIRFFERKEIKDCLAYLRMLLLADDLSFSRIINTPKRQFGDATLKKLSEIAEKEGTSLYNTLKKHIEEPTFNKVAIKDFINLIEEEKILAKNRKITDSLNSLLKKTGLMAMYRDEGDNDRLDNIKELFQSIKYYEDINDEEENSLEKYLQEVSLYTNIDRPEKKSTVKLMTIHQSKGLEFPYVFVIGLTEGIFPSYRSIRELRVRGLEEERRLMYVAVTRAEKALFLTDSEGYSYSSPSGKLPSRFLAEIGESLIKVDGNLDPQLFEMTKSMAADIDSELYPDEPHENASLFFEGMKVMHARLGEGELLSYDEKHDTCTVKFNVGTFSLRSKFIKPME